MNKEFEYEIKLEEELTKEMVKELKDFDIYDLVKEEIEDGGLVGISIHDLKMLLSENKIIGIEVFNGLSASGNMFEHVDTIILFFSLDNNHTLNEINDAIEKIRDSINNKDASIIFGIGKKPNKSFAIFARKK